MNKKAIILILAILAAAAGGYWFFKIHKAGNGDESKYRTQEIDRGKVTMTVTATGTASAVTTVQVGSQVSGVIERIHVDFNSPVRRGQLLAELDPTPFEAQAQQRRVDRRRRRVRRVRRGVRGAQHLGGDDGVAEHEVLDVAERDVLVVERGDERGHQRGRRRQLVEDRAVDARRGRHWMTNSVM